MGLDTTHGCWHGAYSAYYRWRENLLQQTGMFHLTREAFRYIGPKEDWPLYAPLAYLMRHSDCDGTIPLEVQIPLAECLERQIATYPDHANGGGHILDGWHAATKRFADGLRLANSLGEEVEYH